MEQQSSFHGLLPGPRTYHLLPFNRYGFPTTEPVAISGMAAAILTGEIVHIMGPAVAMAISMVAFLIGTILIATAPVSQTYWAQSFVSLLIIALEWTLAFRLQH